MSKAARSYGIKRRLTEIRNMAFFAGLLVGVIGIIMLCKVYPAFWVKLKAWVEAAPAQT